MTFLEPHPPAQPLVVDAGALSVRAEMEGTKQAALAALEAAAARGASAAFGGMGGSTCPTFDASGGGNGVGGAGGGGATSPTGCSDGSRELFMDLATHPDIAGCSGGWEVPGTVTTESRNPACSRRGGNDGLEPTGWGCSIEDMCASGWHVCLDAAEVAAKSGTGMCAFDAGGFWTTRQSQNMAGTCASGQTNNLVGCGVNFGTPAGGTCSPLNLELREVHCNVTCPWICDGDSLFDEAQIVQKYGSDDGGVICCRD